MKKIVMLFMMLILCAVSLNAQKLMGSYTSSYFSNLKNFDVEYDIDDENLFISAIADRQTEKAGFLIKKLQRQIFISNLIESQKKYNDWMEVAKSNNVKDLSKDIIIEEQKIGAYWLNYSGDWKFDYNVNPTYFFRVLETDSGIKYLLIINSGELLASDNRYMNHKSLLIVLTSSNEIQNLIDIISDESIEKFKNKENNKEVLFK